MLNSKATIRSSTLENETENITELWKNEFSGSSISSIEVYFNPKEIKKVVDSLVMSKYGSRYEKKYSKSIIYKKYRNRAISSSDTGSEEMSRTSSISNKNSEISISTVNVSELMTVQQSENYFSCLGNSCDSVASTEYYCSLDFEQFNNKLNTLHNNKKQILKAIRSHEISNRLDLQMERLEAEKMLLITDLKMQTILTEDKFSSKPQPSSSYFGSMTIYNLYLYSEKFVHPDQYFLCTINYHSGVQFSELAKIKSNGLIHFRKRFEFFMLPPNFELQMKIFAISIKDLKKQKNGLSCNFYSNNEEQDHLLLRESLFNLLQETTIDIGNITETESLNFKFKLFSLHASVQILSVFQPNVESFLNVMFCPGSYPCWNRQFCVLEEGCLKFYNYPPRQMLNPVPTNVLDISNCHILKILSREECSRKRSFLIGTNCGKNVILSCESQDDFEFWLRTLKSVFYQMKMWRM